jgi:hypothetical protein
MFYRVVMQGRTMGGADVAAVKREFVRVTGLPVSVADDMFAGMPKVIKRKAPQADAERIAATLRAIGAAATVEREVGSSDADDETDEGIEIIAAPLGNGPPTVAPGMAPPEDQAPATPSQKAWVRNLREKGPVVLGMVAIVGAGIYFAPEVSGWVASFRPAPTAPPPKAVARQTDAEPATAPVALNASLLHGPWRCVDQRTGLGVYWSYAADGGLVFHGEVLSDRAAPASGAAVGWRLEGAKLLHKHAQGEVDAFKVSNLTLSRLRYVGDRGLEIECRRP